MQLPTERHAGQLSLFPTGTLEPRRRHHVARSDAYRVRMGTIQWKAERALALERDGYRCTNCGSEAQLVVHHDNYDHQGDEWPEDLRVLCWNCHDKEHERRAA